ncbi:hypothetical protein [Montanilutibacter psychrotolerans]|uniref:Uncharacterized protein n=1 Tax=Montanilutibacter psychrotolerans TaxID=1327343 RepID=A0A3M8SMI3_9GAMM|nr:hypothetical protein [Lysobacter psychrotolerans]RNF82023.1 hypothetical protein EER27_15350 [Lysobacter psychrotolerans]
MTITVAITALLLIGAWLSIRVLFKEYPDSAIREARDTLFALRSELFELAKSGAIRFDSAAYGFNRSLLNAMIRYAHDVSFVQLLFARVIRKGPAARRYQKEMRAYVGRTHSQVPKPAQEDLDRIMLHADAAMLQLICTRSIAFSGVLWTLTACFAVHHFVGKAKASVKERMESAAAAATQAHHRSRVEESIDEVLESERVRNKIIPAIRIEAFRYMPEDQFANACAA